MRASSTSRLPQDSRRRSCTGRREGQKYILEAIGCGCAFIDYDNDGWMDVFLLSGTRLEGDPEGASNRLYRNNRDGTFTDVTEKAGLNAVGWASGVCVGDYNNDGFEDLFCTVLRPEPAVSQQRRRHVHRRDEGGRTLERRSRAGAPAAASSTTTATAIWICSSRTTCSFSFAHAPVPGANSELQLERHSGRLRTARAAAGHALALSQQRRRDVHRRQQRGRHRRRQPKTTA